MQPVSGDLPDINVWLALAVQEHPHHQTAKAYWADFHAHNTLGAKLWFCRVTMLGLVRVLCQPKVAGQGALSLAKAWRVYQGFRTLPSVGIMSEVDSLEQHLGALVAPPGIDASQALPTRLWTDAYLAAAARSNALRLVTFDHHFKLLSPTHAWVLPTA